jgi:hypothetical protein
MTELKQALNNPSEMQISTESEKVTEWKPGRSLHFLPKVIAFLICTLPAGLFGQPAGISGAGANRVEAEGMAAGDGGNARAEALTAALREAVRIGVGVNLVEQSQVSDFQLDFDRVFAQSFGYVKNYKVLGTDLGEDGIYQVLTVTGTQNTSSEYFKLTRNSSSNAKVFKSNQIS